ncbi:class I SAM-dependent methyltransferase [Flavobacterium ardleyense]|uniref:class I SAM-dependent methyltransferase n=1 Tax=Flavobacterium ardleyense TaxID=2038737 RepID=UPI00298D0287|nr:methyltransferase [Flavobacterium ardleyense]
MITENKAHWEKVYQTKSADQVSWTQEYPRLAIDYLEELNLPKDAAIIDIGGGEAAFAEAAMDLGYTNISVLDISEAALAKAKERLGTRAENIKWIATDIINFETTVKYDFWYDRAVFHFLTDEKHIDKYIEIATKSLVENGNFLLGTFSEIGPFKCSGLEITQYSETSMKETFAKNFVAEKCFTQEHKTPFDSIQNFQFCGFKKIK